MVVKSWNFVCAIMKRFKFENMSMIGTRVPAPRARAHLKFELLHYFTLKSKDGARSKGPNGQGQGPRPQGAQSPIAHGLMDLGRLDMWAPRANACCTTIDVVCAFPNLSLWLFFHCRVLVCSLVDDKVVSWICFASVSRSFLSSEIRA